MRFFFFFLSPLLYPPLLPCRSFFLFVTRFSVCFCFHHVPPRDVQGDFRVERAGSGGWGLLPFFVPPFRVFFETSLVLYTRAHTHANGGGASRLSPPSPPGTGRAFAFIADARQSRARFPVLCRSRPIG